jgi:hypothetical protein
MSIPMLTFLLALSCHAAWDILLYELRRLWLVSIFHCNTLLYIVGYSQRGGMDQNQTFYDPKSELDIHWIPIFNCGANSAPNLQQLPILQ